MNKKKIGIIVILIICAIVVTNQLLSKGPEEILNSEDNLHNSGDTSTQKDLEQLNVILNNKELWYKDDEFDQYSYAVTDLDQNGRLEIISSICQGTGLYTYTTIYEVNETLEELNLCESNLEEYDSQADIIKKNWIVFYDKYTEKYYYVLEDVTRNGMAELYENKRYFCLFNGESVEEYLVRKSTIYQNGIPEITFTDVNDNIINEEEYNKFENKYFNSFEKMMVNIEWLSGFTDISITELEISYRNFNLTK
ncbi:MAG: hypothetical protein IKJ32_04000 [Clostridia bacterium]|nr:hypothetical protein [Clostridia bacterium]